MNVFGRSEWVTPSNNHFWEIKWLTVIVNAKSCCRMTHDKLWVSLSTARRLERERAQENKVASHIYIFTCTVFLLCNETEGKSDVRPLWNRVHSLRVRAQPNEVTLWCISTLDDFMNTFRRSPLATRLRCARLEIQLFRRKKTNIWLKFNFWIFQYSGQLQKLLHKMQRCTRIPQVHILSCQKV